MRPDLLAAQVVNGKAVRFSFDFVSPFMVFDRVPWYRDSSWLLPLLCFSVAVLLLTTLCWPIIAIVRRRFRSPLVLEVTAFRAWRYSRIGATLIVAGLALWATLLGLILTETSNLSSKLDLLFWLAEIYGAVVFIGGLALMLWNLKAVWTARQTLAGQDLEYRAGDFRADRRMGWLRVQSDPLRNQLLVREWNP